MRTLDYIGYSFIRHANHDVNTTPNISGTTDGTWGAITTGTTSHVGYGVGKSTLTVSRGTAAVDWLVYYWTVD